MAISKAPLAPLSLSGRVQRELQFDLRPRVNIAVCATKIARFWMPANTFTRSLVVSWAIAGSPPRRTNSAAIASRRIDILPLLESTA
jgi:hypothetical protein